MIKLLSFFCISLCLGSVSYSSSQVKVRVDSFGDENNYGFIAVKPADEFMIMVYEGMRQGMLQRVLDLQEGSEVVFFPYEGFVKESVFRREDNTIYEVQFNFIDQAYKGGTFVAQIGYETKCSRNQGIKDRMHKLLREE